MVTAKDVQGVMAMMPSFSTKDAGDLTSKNTVDVDNLRAGVDRMINDGIDVITTTGSFGECYNLHWDEYKTLAVATVDAVKKRVPLFIGATSPNAREVVERLKFVQDIGGDGTLLVDRCVDGPMAGVAFEKPLSRGKRSRSVASHRRNHERGWRRAAGRKRRRDGEAAH